jgi:hypothetical protein
MRSRRKTIERRAVDAQCEAAWYAKIAARDQSAAYQFVAADKAKLAWYYLSQLIERCGA